jgi:hypothetical protein
MTDRFLLGNDSPWLKAVSFISRDASLAARNLPHVLLGRPSRQLAGRSTIKTQATVVINGDDMTVTNQVLGTSVQYRRIR